MMNLIQPLDSMFQNTLQLKNVVLIIIVLSLVSILSTRLRSGLRQIPGPFLASISAIDRIQSAYSGRQFAIHQSYHKKYGSLVRVGPKHVSVADAEYIPQIYGITSKFGKSDFYCAFDVNSALGSVPTVFSIRDSPAHSKLKKPIAHAFAMTSLLELEPMADECTLILEDKLDQMAGTPFDLGVWLQWYAFDVISSITFSNRLDFMKSETDVAGIISAIEGRLLYNSVVGMIPSWHKYLLGNNMFAKYATMFPAVARLNSGKYISEFARRQLDRYSSIEATKSQFRDMLARFKFTRGGQPTTISDAELHSHVSSNIFAGSDTTAISLRALFYYLSKNPRCMEKVLAEIDEADSQGELSVPITFVEGNKLKYFQACLKEALRMHPAVGFMLERLVPKGGSTFGDVHLPEGTIVGINPWVLAYDTGVYGKDAYSFRPERWLEADPEQYKRMDRSHFAFGSGARTCIGKNVSLMEMSKLVPQLLRDFKFEMVNPDAEWQLHDFWFVRQTNLHYTAVRRVKT